MANIKGGRAARKRDRQNAKANKRNVLDYIEDRDEFYNRINKFYDSIIGKIEN